MSKDDLKVIPHNEWLQNNLLKVKAKIRNNMDQNLCIPTEWNEQYNSLIEQLKNSR